MAAVEFGVNDPLAVKLWTKKLRVETLKKTYVDKFIGTSKNSLLYEQSDLKKAAGDRIRMGLRVQFSGAGVLGDGTLEGNEEAMQTYYDDLIVNQLRHAARSKGKMSEQRVPFSVRQENMDGLSDWTADRFDTAFANQICGNTAVTDVRYTGLQATIAPDASHQIFGGNATTDETCGAGDEFDLKLIDKCVEKAKTFSGSNMGMRPLKIGGKDYYVMFLHPYQVYDMRTNTNTSQWADIQQAAMQGGKVEDNPIFTGALGIYNGTVLHEWTRVTTGVNSTTGVAVANTRRAVFCGAQAACIGFAGGTGGIEGFEWEEELFDYRNSLGVSAGAIYGLKKSVFNSRDFATIVASTYAVAHS